MRFFCMLATNVYGLGEVAALEALHCHLALNLMRRTELQLTTEPAI
jgi:hypothetical protein